MFWKNKCINLICVTEIWIIIYKLFLTFYLEQPFYIVDFIKELLFLRQVNISHIWYMPMLIGLYLFVPIIANAFSEIDAKILLFPIAICGIYIFVVPSLNVVISSLGYDSVSYVFGNGFSGGSYGIYLLLGFLMKKGICKTIKSVYLIIVGMIMFLLCILLQMFAYSRLVAYNIWYDNVFLLILGVCIFEYVTIIKRITFKKVLTLLGEYSFAIYLIHNPIKIICTPYMSMLKYRPLQVTVLSIVTLMISAALAFLIAKIPKVGKYILYMRG